MTLKNTRIPCFAGSLGSGDTPPPDLTFPLLWRRRHFPLSRLNPRQSYLCGALGLSAIFARLGFAARTAHLAPPTGFS